MARRCGDHSAFIGRIPRVPPWTSLENVRPCSSEPPVHPPPNRATLISAACWILPLLLYWLVLALRLPYPISRQLSNYSSLLFLATPAAFYLAFRPRPPVSLLAALALTMLLASLSVSSLWTSGQSTPASLGPAALGFEELLLRRAADPERPAAGGVNAVRRPCSPGCSHRAAAVRR
jgi:hypothetical protein